MPPSAPRPDRACGERREGAVRIGISGWRYPPWRGTFYPTDLPQRRELEYAARLFASIELNGSFYSLQRPADYAAWHDATPEGFVFAVKGPRFVTHLKALKDVEAPLANFFASGLANLGAKLGPFLWQLPPRMRFDRERLSGFLALLPRDTSEAAALAAQHDERVEGRSVTDYVLQHPLRHALEVRHESFRDASFVALLRDHGVALVVADTAGRWPYLEDVTADFMYLRLHGDVELYVSGYSKEALGRWAARIGRWRGGGQPENAALAAPASTAPSASTRDVYCYFDNDVKVRAPIDARNLRLLVDGGEGPWARLGPAAHGRRKVEEARARSGTDRRWPWRGAR